MTAHTTHPTKTCKACGKTKYTESMHQTTYGKLISNGDGSSSYSGGDWYCDNCEE